MDSTTAAAIAQRRGFDVHALSIRYGQRHAVELEAARRVATSLGIARHVVIDIDLRAFGGSALTAEIEVPKDTPIGEIGSGIPATYVPARNTVFLSLALAWAETLGACDIFLGANALDYSGYPDCRPEYIEAFQRMANLATKAGVEGGGRITIHTPLITLSKREIVTQGLALGLDYAITSTCYDPAPDGAACGHCEACLLRLKGFREAGVEDPARYGGETGNRSYAVKEIFYTLQGEGANTGRPAVFCRFAGCNLWSGRKTDRETAVCGFCDTDFVGTDGPGGGKFASAEQVASAVASTWPPDGGHGRRLVVCTGGEPLLQLDQPLLLALHEAGFEVAVETNGTIAPPPGIDWLCVSPKAGAELVVRGGNELKLVYPQEGGEPELFEDMGFDQFFLQPMDGPDRDANTQAALRYCLRHPRWRLSLQTHKLLGIP